MRRAPRAAPGLVIPPPGGFTTEAFLELRGLPRPTKLIDGSLVFPSPQDKWHSRVINLLVRELDRQAPTDLRADRGMAVYLSERQVLEPDVIVVTTDADDRAEPSTHHLPDDVVLAVEAVSPDSEECDRDTKPRRYAGAGIRNFWRLERAGDTTVAYVTSVITRPKRAPSRACTTAVLPCPYRSRWTST